MKITREDIEAIYAEINKDKGQHPQLTEVNIGIILVDIYNRGFTAGYEEANQEGTPDG